MSLHKFDVLDRELAAFGDASYEIKAEPGDLRIVISLNGRSYLYQGPLPIHLAVDQLLVADRVAAEIPAIIKWASREPS